VENTAGATHAFHHQPQVVNHDRGDYHVPVNADAPQLDVLLVRERKQFVNALHLKGIGKLGISGAGAAIGNAVSNAPPELGAATIRLYQRSGSITCRRSSKGEGRPVPAGSGALFPWKFTESASRFGRWRVCDRRGEGAGSWWRSGVESGPAAFRPGFNVFRLSFSCRATVATRPASFIRCGPNKPQVAVSNMIGRCLQRDTR
jgi:hypothetical protein